MAERWGVTTRRINQLCAENYFPGAYKEGKFWMIPSDAGRPAVLREKKSPSRVRITKLLPCPVGITSYKEVSKECYYVDKTLQKERFVQNIFTSTSCGRRNIKINRQLSTFELRGMNAVRFQYPYQSQQHYRKAADRENDQVLEDATLTFPQAAAILGGVSLGFTDSAGLLKAHYPYICEKPLQNDSAMKNQDNH